MNRVLRFHQFGQRYYANPMKTDLDCQDLFDLGGLSIRRSVAPWNDFHLKDVRRENVDFSSFVLPGIGRETGFLTGMLQEGFSVPAILRCHLRQKKA